MKGHISNIEKDSIDNENFRKVVYTAKHSQLVLMSLKPKEDIGEEVHDVDQFLRIEAGSGKAILDGVDGLRFAFSGVSAFSPFLSFGVLAGVGFAFIGFGVYQFSKIQL